MTRIAQSEYRREDLADVRFVPLLGEEGWAPEEAEPARVRRAPPTVAASEERLVKRIADVAEPFGSIDTADLGPLLERIGDARVVLLGEATHGTSEFYRMRERISRELIVKKGFRFIAIEGDWPDAARVDHYVRHRRISCLPNGRLLPGFRPGCGATTRCVISSTGCVSTMLRPNPRRGWRFTASISTACTCPFARFLSYLDEVDPDAAKVARQRYGCLTPWQGDPATYGHAALTGSYGLASNTWCAHSRSYLEKRVAYAEHDGERFFDAVQNARLVANAERYYRIMYYGSRASWNLRDEHMFTTLKNLLAFYGTASKAIVWAHNSHVGDSAATEMASRGEHNIGHLCRQEFGGSAYLVGFGTNSGTVAAASDWDGPMEIKKVQPALPKSYERLCHATGHARFTLGLRNRADADRCAGLGQAAA